MKWTMNYNVISHKALLDKQLGEVDKICTESRGNSINVLQSR